MIPFYTDYIVHDNKTTAIIIEKYSIKESNHFEKDKSEKNKLFLNASVYENKVAIYNDTTTSFTEEKIIEDLLENKYIETKPIKTYRIKALKLNYKKANSDNIVITSDDIETMDIKDLDNIRKERVINNA